MFTAIQTVIDLSYKTVGGMRASIYNAMPLQGVEALINFMREFQRRYG